MAQLIENFMHLTQANLKKIADAISQGKDAVVSFAKEHLQGQHPLMLLKNQFEKVKKALKIGKGLRLKFSPTQLKKMAKHGGFLPFLAPLLGGLMTAAKFALPALATGALGGVASEAVSAIGRKVRGEGLLDGAIKGAIMGNGLTQFGTVTGSGRPRGRPKKNNQLMKSTGAGLYQFGQIPMKK